jgi:hypothetical protein
MGGRVPQKPVGGLVLGGVVRRGCAGFKNARAWWLLARDLFTVARVPEIQFRPPPKRN